MDALEKVLEAEAAYLDAIIDALGDLPEVLNMPALTRYHNVTLRALEISETELRKYPEQLAERRDNVKQAIVQYRQEKLKG